MLKEGDTVQSIHTGECFKIESIEVLTAYTLSDGHTRGPTTMLNHYKKVEDENNGKKRTKISGFDSQFMRKTGSNVHSDERRFHKDRPRR